ncbi:MAG: RNA pseudouridine synthase [Elusimicrobia bacterium]|nr:RNA pseudouridine synthase [Elusimicrobiota bacterium]
MDPSIAPTVFYEDNHVIVVYKPAGVLVQGDASNEPTLMDAVKLWLAKKYDKPGKVFLGLVQRLDRPVCGVILFARTSKAASRLSEQIRARTIEKTYRAMVEGTVEPESLRLTHWLSEDDGFVTAHDEPGPDRKEARLGLRVLRRDKATTLLEIDLETGRKHQIRVQLARAGHPIVGDSRYGARLPWPRPGIALAAVRLRFKHPTQDRELSIELPAELDPLRGCAENL